MVCFSAQDLLRTGCVWPCLWLLWFGDGSALPGFKAGMLRASPLPHPELGEGEQWVPSGEGRTQCWGGECSLHFHRAGRCSLLTPQPSTFWPCCHILLPVQMLSHDIHHVKPKQSLHFLWKINFSMHYILLGLKRWLWAFCFVSNITLSSQSSIRV